jgi:CRP-like cAMP-binding protein
MLTVIEKVIFLQNVDVFADVPTEHLAYLAAITREVDFHRGETIYREHEAPDALYLVLDGSVRLERDGREITTAGGHEAFGTWALFDEEPRVASAVAVDDCHVLKVARDDFVDLLADHVQITQGVLKAIAGRLRGLVERVGVESVARPQVDRGSTQTE